MTLYDHRPAIDRLIDGGPPPASWGGPPRALPPRPLPRHLTNPAPPRRWGRDLRTITRLTRARRALARITRGTTA